MPTEPMCIVATLVPSFQRKTLVHDVIDSENRSYRTRSAESAGSLSTSAMISRSASCRSPDIARPSSAGAGSGGRARRPSRLVGRESHAAAIPSSVSAGYFVPSAIARRSFVRPAARAAGVLLCQAGRRGGVPGAVRWVARAGRAKGGRACRYGHSRRLRRGRWRI